MIELDTSPSFLYPRKEVWFAQDPETMAAGGETLFYQCFSEPPPKAMASSVFTTSCIDLAQPNEHLFENVSKKFRREIRKAASEGVCVRAIHATDSVEAGRWLNNWINWSREKNMPQPNTRRIKAMLGSGSFQILQAHQGDTPLVYHAYLSDGERARLLTSHHYTECDDKTLIGWANKYLHWRAICHFQEKQVKVYDLGGVDTQAAPGIARFKLAFGGVEELSYNFQLISPFAMLLKRSRSRLRRGPG